MVMPFKSPWKKKAIRRDPRPSTRLPGSSPARRRASCREQPIQSSRSGGNQLVLACGVELEEEELAVDEVPVRAEADRLPQDRGRLIRRLDRGQGVGAGRGLPRIAHRAQ